MIGLGTAKRELADENFARFRRVFGQCQDVRRIGSAALKLAYTACGRQGGYFEIYLKPWLFEDIETAALSTTLKTAVKPCQ